MRNKETPEEIKYKIRNDLDYILCNKFKNSLNDYLVKHPEGVSNKIISKLLGMAEKKIEIVYAKIIKKLQKKMGQ